MTLTGAVLTGCLLLSVACTKTASPSLRVETRVFEKKERGVVFRATYPVAVAGPAAQAINDRIAKEMLFGEKVKDLEESAQKLMDDYRKFRKEFPDSAMEHSDERTAQVLYSSASVVSLAFTQDSFLGGAHPNSIRNLVNLDVQTGEQIALSSLLMEGAMPKLTALGEVALRREREIPAPQKLSQAGFFKDTFALNQNYAIGDRGLTFYFNYYEIGPRVMGPSEIFLPYSSIQELVRKDTPYLPKL